MKSLNFIGSPLYTTLFILSTLNLTVFAGLDDGDVKVKGVTDGIECEAHLFLPSEKKDLPLVVFMDGMGVYLTKVVKEKARHGTFSPDLSQLFAAGKIALLSIDRPGLEQDGEKIKRLPAHSKYLQEDLMECVINATKWARKNNRVNVEGPLVWKGHSEGAQVMARAYAKLLAANDDLFKAISLLVFSSPPFEPWAAGYNKILWKQEIDKSEKDRSPEFKDKETIEVGGQKLKLTYKSQREYWENFLKTGNGTEILGHHSQYIAQLIDEKKTELLAKTLSRIVEKRAKVRIATYHGVGDDYDMGSAIYEFEEEFGKQVETAMRLKRNEIFYPEYTARYYQAGHGLNGSAIVDMRSLIAEAISIPVAR